MYPFPPLLHGNGLEVHLGEVVAKVTVALVPEYQAVLVAAQVRDEPRVAPQRREDLVFDFQARDRTFVVSVVNVFENRPIRE